MLHAHWDAVIPRLQFGHLRMLHPLECAGGLERGRLSTPSVTPLIRLALVHVARIGAVALNPRV